MEEEKKVNEELNEEVEETVETEETAVAVVEAPKKKFHVFPTKEEKQAKAIKKAQKRALKAELDLATKLNPEDKEAAEQLKTIKHEELISGLKKVGAGVAVAGGVVGGVVMVVRTLSGKSDGTIDTTFEEVPADEGSSVEE